MHKKTNPWTCKTYINKWAEFHPVGGTWIGDTDSQRQVAVIE